MTAIHTHTATRQGHAPGRPFDWRIDNEQDNH